MSNLYIGDDNNNHHLIKLHGKVSQSKWLLINIWNTVWQPKHSVEVTHMAALHETVKELLPRGGCSRTQLDEQSGGWAPEYHSPLQPAAPVQWTTRPTAHGGPNTSSPCSSQGLILILERVEMQTKMPRLRLSLVNYSLVIYELTTISHPTADRRTLVWKRAM